MNILIMLFVRTLIYFIDFDDALVTKKDKVSFISFS